MGEISQLDGREGRIHGIRGQREPGGQAVCRSGRNGHGGGEKEKAAEEREGEVRFHGCMSEEDGKN